MSLKRIISDRGIWRIAGVLVEDYLNDYTKSWVYHTSPNEITEIRKDGLFGDILFFSGGPYAMSPNRGLFVYRMDLPKEDRISTRMFFYEDNWELLQPFVSTIMEEFDVDEDIAGRYLSDREYPDDPEAMWTIQAIQGHAAKALGYVAAESEDEQGQVYIVPMSGRLQDLELVETGW